MSRVPWGNDFPSVFANCPWKSDNAKLNTLSTHPLYAAAKGQRDVGAALSIIDDLHSREAILSLVDYVESLGTTPYLIAPSCQPGDSNNALAIAYAQWLSREFEWPVDTEVFQEKTVSRDRSNGWMRIAHRSQFFGQIDRRRPYVIVDDVITMGGTLADLRSFIHGQGGRVIAMSAIASRDGRPTQIRLGDDTRTRLEQSYGKALSAFCRDVLGYTYEGLTDPEGRLLLTSNGYDDIRKRVLRARDAENARGSPRSARRAS